MLIDSHAHLTDEFFNNISILQQHWEYNGISNVFAVGYNLETSIQSVEIANKYSHIYAIIGIHPDDIADYNQETEARLAELATNPKVIGIGEIGLDYHRISSEDVATKLKQQEVLISQIKLADKLNLPIMIHLRDACKDMIDILNANRQYLNHGGVIHCFSESVDSFKIFKKLGFAIGVGGVITFKNSKKLNEVVQAAELSDIVLETDCPFMAPEPIRGTTNEPKNIKIIAEKVCEIKGVELETLASVTHNNLRRIFPKFNE